MCQFIQNNLKEVIAFLIAGFGMIWFEKGKNRRSQTPLIFGEMNVRWIEFS